MVGIYTALIFISILVFIIIVRLRKPAGGAQDNAVDDCCGAHEVCEKESLLNTSARIEYYDDEELDVFAGRTPDDYDESEIERFCDVFYTLRDYDVAGWLKSLQMRGIELPESLRDEALLIVRERRYREK